MLVDRELVMRVLDTKDPRYEEWQIDLNTLPKDAIFEIIIDDIVTAEYLDKNGELHIFNLNFEYDTPTNVPPRLEEYKLKKEMEDSLSEHNEFGLNTKDKFFSVLKLIAIGMIAVPMIFIIGASIYQLLIK